jgi:hypothetical protein
MNDTPVSPDPDDLDPNDDQLQAEAFDDENVEPDMDLDDYGPDHGLAVREAMVVTDTGDVPADSIEERAWREEPDRLRPDTRGWDEELIEPHPDFGLDQDFADESAPSYGHQVTDGIAVGEVAGPVETLLPAEEAAIHIVGGDDDSRF